jgi:hypothetical protein
LAGKLRGGFEVRPAEALHLLSLVTRPAYYEDDVHDAYAWWGLLRYLGFFDHEQDDPQNPVLRVSLAGRRVAGAQRRVASEELGIAFGVLVATTVLREKFGPGVPVSIVDVDLLVRDSGYGSSSRADYLLVSHAADAPPGDRMFFLECKGTSDPAKSCAQLTKAVSQIARPLFGRLAPGLAVSTVTSTDQLSYAAMELTGVGAAETRRDDEDTHGLASASLRSSWALLGHYGGNQAAVQQWSPNRVGNMRVAGGERRIRIESAHGPAVGITRTFDLGDRQLAITWALDLRVDDALTSGDYAAVLAAQQAFARDLDGSGSVQQAGDAGPETSTGSVVASSGTSGVPELDKLLSRFRAVLSSGVAPEADATDAHTAREAAIVAGEPVESVMPDGSIFSVTVI